MEDVSQLLAKLTVAQDHTAGQEEKRTVSQRSKDNEQTSSKRQRTDSQQHEQNVQNAVNNAFRNFKKTNENEKEKEKKRIAINKIVDAKKAVANKTFVQKQVEKSKGPVVVAAEINKQAERLFEKKKDEGDIFEEMKNKLELYLNQHKLQIKDVPGDGNCFFWALSDQFFGKSFYGSDLRVATVTFMKNNRTYYEKFLSEDFDPYIKRMYQHKTYATELEVNAACQYFGCKIKMYKVLQGQENKVGFYKPINTHAFNGIDAGLDRQTPKPNNTKVYEMGNINNVHFVSTEQKRNFRITTWQEYKSKLHVVRGEGDCFFDALSYALHKDAAQVGQLRFDMLQFATTIKVDLLRRIDTNGTQKSKLTKYSNVLHNMRNNTPGDLPFFKIKIAALYLNANILLLSCYDGKATLFTNNNKRQRNLSAQQVPDERSLIIAVDEFFNFYGTDPIVEKKDEQEKKLVLQNRAQHLNPGFQLSDAALLRMLEANSKGNIKDRAQQIVPHAKQLKEARVKQKPSKLWNETRGGEIVGFTAHIGPSNPLSENNEKDDKTLEYYPLQQLVMQLFLWEHASNINMRDFIAEHSEAKSKRHSFSASRDEMLAELSRATELKSTMNDSLSLLKQGKENASVIKKLEKDIGDVEKEIEGLSKKLSTIQSPASITVAAQRILNMVPIITEDKGNMFVLSVIVEGKVEHYAVERDAVEKEFTVDGNPTGVNTLSELSDYLSTKRDWFSVALTNGVTPKLPEVQIIDSDKFKLMGRLKKQFPPNSLLNPINYSKKAKEILTKQLRPPKKSDGPNGPFFHENINQEKAEELLLAGKVERGKFLFTNKRNNIHRLNKIIEEYEIDKMVMDKFDRVERDNRVGIVSSVSDEIKEKLTDEKNILKEMKKSFDNKNMSEKRFEAKCEVAFRAIETYNSELDKLGVKDRDAQITWILKSRFVALKMKDWHLKKQILNLDAFSPEAKEIFTKLDEERELLVDAKIKYNNKKITEKEFEEKCTKAFTEFQKNNEMLKVLGVKDRDPNVERIKKLKFDGLKNKSNWVQPSRTDLKRFKEKTHAREKRREAHKVIETVKKNLKYNHKVIIEKLIMNRSIIEDMYKKRKERQNVPLTDWLQLYVNYIRRKYGDVFDDSHPLEQKEKSLRLVFSAAEEPKSKKEIEKKRSEAQKKRTNKILKVLDSNGGYDIARLIKEANEMAEKAKNAMEEITAKLQKAKQRLKEAYENLNANKILPDEWNKIFKESFEAFKEWKHEASRFNMDKGENEITLIEKTLMPCLAQKDSGVNGRGSTTLDTYKRIIRDEIAFFGNAEIERKDPVREAVVRLNSIFAEKLSFTKTQKDFLTVLRMVYGEERNMNVGMSQEIRQELLSPISRAPFLVVLVSWTLKSRILTFNTSPKAKNELAIPVVDEKDVKNFIRTNDEKLCGFLKKDSLKVEQLPPDAIEYIAKRIISQINLEFWSSEQRVFYELQKTKLGKGVEWNQKAIKGKDKSKKVVFCLTRPRRDRTKKQVHKVDVSGSPLTAGTQSKSWLSFLGAEVDAETGVVTFVSPKSVFRDAGIKVGMAIVKIGAVNVFGSRVSKMLHVLENKWHREAAGIKTFQEKDKFVKYNIQKASYWPSAHRQLVNNTSKTFVLIETESPEPSLLKSSFVDVWPRIELELFLAKWLTEQKEYYKRKAKRDSFLVFQYKTFGSGGVRTFTHVLFGIEKVVEDFLEDDVFDNLSLRELIFMDVNVQRKQTDFPGLTWSEIMSDFTVAETIATVVDENAFYRNLRTKFNRYTAHFKIMNMTELHSEFYP